MKNQPRVSVIILTGGNGNRIKGSSVPKQFIEILGKPIFIHCMDIYEKLEEVDDIFLVINKEYEKRYQKLLSDFPFRKIRKLAYGGKFRQESIKKGLDLIEHKGFAVIQSGANPTTPSRLIKECIRQAKDGIAVTAYSPLRYTVLVKNDSLAKDVVRKDNLGYANDPLVVDVDVLKKAFSLVDEYKEDVPVLELLSKSGCPITLIESPVYNIKVTWDIDLKVVEYILVTKKEYERENLCR